MSGERDFFGVGCGEGCSVLWDGLWVYKVGIGGEEGL